MDQTDDSAPPVGQTMGNLAFDDIPLVGGEKGSLSFDDIPIVSGVKGSLSIDDIPTMSEMMEPAWYSGPPSQEDQPDPAADGDVNEGTSKTPASTASDVLTDPTDYTPEAPIANISSQSPTGPDITGGNSSCDTTSVAQPETDATADSKPATTDPEQDPRQNPGTGSANPQAKGDQEQTPPPDKVIYDEWGNPIRPNGHNEPGVDIFVYPMPDGQNGYAYYATDNQGNSVTGHFNTTTDNFFQIPPGDYTVSPRRHIEPKQGYEKIAQWAHQLLELNWPHDPNMRYGFPTLSNTDDWNTIIGPDGKMWTARMIHPGRNPTGEGGESEGCLIPNLEDYKKLLPMLCDQYNNGGVRLHKMP